MTIQPNLADGFDLEAECRRLEIWPVPMEKFPSSAKYREGLRQLAEAAMRHAYERFQLQHVFPPPKAKWDDPRVQTVYDLLCHYDPPPPDQHWEGWVARRIVDALDHK